MPPARRSARSTSRRSAAYKEPAALKQLNKSLASAQKALTELRKHAGREATKGTQSLHGDLRKFVSNAKRDTGKFTTAMKRDFEQAQKAVASSAQSARSQTGRGSGRKSSTSSRRSSGSSRKSSASSRTSSARGGARRSTRKSS
jgi:hypothetical protein